MKPRGLSVCYYPSTIVFVDDDPALLMAMTEQVQDYAPCVAFTETDAAIEYIRARAGRHFKERMEMDDPFNENQIHREIYQEARYEDLALIVVDYQMPRKNGIQFAEAISDLQIPVIMLTGEADEVLAVDAFNEDLIDAYFKKSMPNLAERLAHKIFELQMRHFLDGSLTISSSLSDRRVQPLSTCFHDRQFIAHFKKFFQASQFVEYYLYRCPGDFLMLDREGHPTWFIVRERHEMDAINQKILDHHGRSFKTMEEQALKFELDHYQRIAFFSDPKALEGPISEWENYLHPCQSMDSDEGKIFYYALIPYQAAHGVLDLSKLKGFQGYMKHHQIQIDG